MQRKTQYSNSNWVVITDPMLVYGTGSTRYVDPFSQNNGVDHRNDDTAGCWAFFYVALTKTLLDVASAMDPVIIAIHVVLVMTVAIVVKIAVIVPNVMIVATVMIVVTVMNVVRTVAIAILLIIIEVNSLPLEYILDVILKH